MNDKFLDSVMNSDTVTKITICGSRFLYNEMDNYNTYLTLHNNIVYSPVRYLDYLKNLHAGHNHEITVDDNDIKLLKSIHMKKIDESDAILVVIGDREYMSTNTKLELDYARSLGKKIIFDKTPVTFSSPDEMVEWENTVEFNHDDIYTLYRFKEEDNLDEFIERVSRGI